MGGNRVESHGSDDGSYDEDGYDESQLAEIQEVTGDGPTDGTLMTDIPSEFDADDDDDADDLTMEDGEVGQESVADVDEEDLDEDDLQDDFDDDPDGLGLDDEGDLDDEDDAALKP